MKMTKVVVAVVAMCAMFATEVNAQTSSPKNEQSAVLKVTRSNRVITKTTATDTVVAQKTTINQVSDEFKMARYEARLKGETAPGAYFDNENRDIEGNVLSRPFVEIGGGGSYLFSGSEFRPTLNATIGWEKKNMLIFSTFDASWKGYNVSSDLTDDGMVEGAEASGRYNSLNATLNFAYKVLQDARYMSYVAPYVGAGYGYCKTDGDSEEIRYSSSFYGFLWTAGVRGKWGLSRHVGIAVNLSVGNVARNYHDSKQDMNAIGLKGSITLGYTF